MVSGMMLQRRGSVQLNGVCCIQVQSMSGLLVVSRPCHFGRDRLGFQFPETEVQCEVVLVALAGSTFDVASDDAVTNLDADG